ncbi:MAG TPA: FAD-dependent oxidoreductase [Thiobacillus sp.]
MHPIVIVGSGLAGYTLLKEFRKRDSTSPVALITADDGAFYSKPNLSNALAANKTSEDLASASADKLAVDLNVTIMAHTRVNAIDTATKRVSIDDGELDYSSLILALGADPIPHGLMGDGSAAVLAVNDLTDYAVFRGAINGKKHVTVLGGGLIGCEFANDLAHAGFAVDVVHLGDWPLERLLPVEAGRRLADGLTALGVSWHFGHTARRVETSARGVEVELDHGARISTDVVLSAIGLLPRIQLALAAGIPVGRGIKTNRLLETGAPNVYAMGDCAEVDGLNLPYVMPLMVQARALAATLTGTPTPVLYPPMPVIIKTPAHPVVVVPPKVSAAGGWKVECSHTGVSALHVDENGVLQGFALTGSETSRRAALVKALLV